MSQFSLTVSRGELDALKKLNKPLADTIEAALRAYLRKYASDPFAPLSVVNSIGKSDYMAHETMVTVPWNVPSSLQSRLYFYDEYAAMSHLRVALREHLRANGVTIQPEPMTMNTDKIVSDCEPLDFTLTSTEYDKLQRLGGTMGEHVKQAVMANRRGPAPNSVELDLSANLGAGGTIKNLSWRIPDDCRSILPGNALDRSARDYVRASVVRYLSRKSV